MNPICEARQETFVAHAGDVHTDTGMGDCLFGAEPVRQPDAGVQSDRLPHHLDPIVRHAVPAQEARRGVGTLNLETLVTPAVVGDAEIVSYREVR